MNGETHGFVHLKDRQFSLEFILGRALLFVRKFGQVSLSMKLGDLGVRTSTLGYILSTAQPGSLCISPLSFRLKNMMNREVVPFLDLIEC